MSICKGSVINSEVQEQYNAILCAKAGSHQFCILCPGSLREETPWFKMSAVCVPGESVGDEENFQMFYAYMRETRKLPSPKVSTGKLRNKGINKFCAWCNVFGFVCFLFSFFFFNFILLHLRKKQILWIFQYDMAKQTPWIPAAVATVSSCPLPFVLLRGNVGWHTTFKKLIIG